MSSSPLFQLENKTISYGSKRVIEDISIRIEAGEKVALVGESGAGKSTLLKLFYHQQRQRVALCPQDLGLVPELSVFHNIYMGRLDRFGWWHNLVNLISPRRTALAEIRAIARELGLEAQLQSSVDSLSGGQMQRTALGRALYQQGEVFLGDEPVSAVDEFQADKLLQLICTSHPTLVVALHDQALALKHFQRIVGLKEGRIVLDAASETLSLDDLATIYRA